MIDPARQTRWETEIHNEGPADVYIGPSSSVDQPTGRLLAAGATIKLRTSGAIYAFDPTNVGAQVTATEVYS